MSESSSRFSIDTPSTNSVAVTSTGSLSGSTLLGAGESFIWSTPTLGITEHIINIFSAIEPRATMAHHELCFKKQMTFGIHVDAHPDDYALLDRIIREVWLYTMNTHGPVVESVSAIIGETISSSIVASAMRPNETDQNASKTLFDILSTEINSQLVWEYRPRHYRIRRLRDEDHMLQTIRVSSERAHASVDSSSLASPSLKSIVYLDNERRPFHFEFFGVQDIRDGNPVKLSWLASAENVTYRTHHPILEGIFKEADSKLQDVRQKLELEASLDGPARLEQWNSAISERLEHAIKESFNDGRLDPILLKTLRESTSLRQTGSAKQMALTYYGFKRGEADHTSRGPAHDDGSEVPYTFFWSSIAPKLWSLDEHRDKSLQFKHQWSQA